MQPFKRTISINQMFVYDYIYFFLNIFQANYLYSQILPSLFTSRHVSNSQRKREKRCKLCPLKKNTEKQKNRSNMETV
jgi:hypothetical protein